jgi:hypothetical protein
MRMPCSAGHSFFGVCTVACCSWSTVYPDYLGNTGVGGNLSSAFDTALHKAAKKLEKQDQEGILCSRAKPTKAIVQT